MMTNSDPENIVQPDALNTGVWDYALPRQPNSASPNSSIQEDSTDVSWGTEGLMSPIQALTAEFSHGVGSDENSSISAKGKSSDSAVNTQAVVRHGFRIGDLQLMIRYEDSSSLSEMFVVHRLPNSPEWFLGITNLRGKLIPIFDLGRYMGLDHRTFSREMLLVLGHGSDAVGILIDGLLERLRLVDEESGNMDAAPAKLTSHLRSSSLIDGEIWYDLDVQSLIGDIEQTLKGFTSTA